MITDENGNTQIFDSEAEADLNRMNITHPSNKPKPPRKVRPRVLKSEYDKLKAKYEIARLCAILGWVIISFSLGLYVAIKMIP